VRSLSGILVRYAKVSIQDVGSSGDSVLAARTDGAGPVFQYCIFRYTDSAGNVSVFQYVRGKGQGESRLHSKRSIGIGGHISTLDVSETQGAGMQRELEEEVTIGSTYKEACVGLINDDQNEVGKVHLGVVHVFDVDQPKVTANESEIIESGFVPVQELLAGLEQCETWSQICLKALFGSESNSG